MSIRLLSWNVHGLSEPWNMLATDSSIDVALLQEARRPPSGVDLRVIPEDEAWFTAGTARRPFRAIVVGCSERVTLIPEPAVRPIGSAGDDDVPVSRLGTLAAATLAAPGIDPVVVCSVYATWETPAPQRGWIYADASAHRIVSDISALVGSQRGHRLIVAGDWNILQGYGEEGSPHWARRYDSVFERMEAIGLRFVGPQHPDGHLADPHPPELPAGSRNVPTYRSRREDPSSATRQLDFVFASESIADRVRTRALNGPHEWGPSDHCRIVIEIS